MLHILPGTDDGEGNPTQISVTHTYTGDSYDPSQGAIDHLVWSEDQIIFDPPFDGAAVGTLALVFQDDQTFSASINDGNVYTNTDWQRVTVELRRSDFAPAPGPNFTASGAPITFGILRSNTHRGSREIVIDHGLDNWRIEVVPG